MLNIFDMCCGAGGASQGIKDACPTVNIRGMDIKSQPDYPFHFLQCDVMIQPLYFLRQFDFIWASFPCQSYTYASKKARNNGKTYPDLVAEGRKLLLKTGKPFVMENVTTAPIRKDLILCGEMFGLKVIRHRAFEIHGFRVPQPMHINHRGKVKDGFYVTVAGHGGDGKASLKSWQDAMQIHWTKDKKSIAEAVPPAYSKYIFEYFLLQKNKKEDGVPPTLKSVGIPPKIL